MNESDLSNLSDDEIMNMEKPPEMEAQPVQEETPAEAAPVDETIEAENETPTEETQNEPPSSEGDDSSNSDGVLPEDESTVYGASDDEESPPKQVVSKKSTDDDASKASDTDDGKSGTKQTKSDDASKKAGDAETKEKSESPDAVDYKAQYEAVMAPFKANGKEIKLSSPEEVRQLLQMGANYTKKLQTLQPNLKMMKMLENQGLLDEGKLSYLIDLDKKNPEAIKKLIKESGLDPLDIDTSEEDSYKGNNYSVSDREMSFNNALDDAKSNPVGQEVLITINKDWDAESKEAVFQDPNIIKIMTHHKEAGYYDQISAEVEREKLLGNFEGVPFIQAYNQVGQVLQKNGWLKGNQPAPAQVAKEETPVPPQQPQQTRTVLETRPAQRKPPQNQNGDLVKAVSPVKTAAKKVEQEFNPLSMSDEDFEKQTAMASRL